MRGSIAERLSEERSYMRPNILYLHSHDTGRYVQPYGHAIPTPHIQRLAEQGVLFRQAFCSGPTCSPSRASLVTGQWAHSSGMIGLAHRGFVLQDHGHHIVHTLRRVGYTSALIGVQHVATDPARIGYDRVVEVDSRGVEHVAPAAVDFLSHDLPQPFFLSVGFSETHREFPSSDPGEDGGRGQSDRYCLPPATLPDTLQTRRDMAAFKASAQILDRGVGAVLDALDATGLVEDTLVICTTDHGIAFPGMKCNLTDHGIGVMLIMRGLFGDAWDRPFGSSQGEPSGFTGGRVCDAMVSHVDLFPTICELLEIEPPHWLQGESMMPLIRGEAEAIREEIFAEVTYHAAYEPQRAVRTRRWKYIRRFDGRSRPNLPNCDDSLSKEVWLEHGWRERPVASEQLFDLIFDPYEAHNLADDPTTRDVLEEMRGRMERWMRDTDDPLLQGPVPAPLGARVNDPDGLSPREPTRVVGE
jgi:N-sulfoglucosamine sulfohydrolase